MPARVPLGGAPPARARGAAVLAPALVAALVLAAGCGPSEPPARPLPPLHVEVEIDSELRAPLDAERLARTPPDLEDAERRAWDLGPLLGEAYYVPGCRLDVIDSGRTSVSFAEPSRRQDGRRPALVLNQKGEWFVELVRPEDAETVHGRGGNRGRPDERTHRVVDVARLRLFTPDLEGRRRQAAGARDRIEVTFGGETLATWTPKTLQELPPPSLDRQSPRHRESYGLRGAVANLPGPAKRVARIEDVSGQETLLDEAVWKDASRLPILRLNQRGLVKLEWIDKSGRRADGPEVRGVRRIELVEATP